MQVTYTFFVLISIFSLVLGYYDIIKNVPLFRKVMPVDCTTPVPKKRGSHPCEDLLNRIGMLQ